MKMRNMGQKYVTHYKKFGIWRHLLRDPYIRTVADYIFATVIATVSLKGRRFYTLFFQVPFTIYLLPKYLSL